MTRGVRGAAHLRRGQDRLPGRPRRRRGAVRHHARPRHVRQGAWATAIRRRRSAVGARSWTCCPSRSATAARTPATGSPRRPRSRRSRSSATRTPWRPSAGTVVAMQAGIRSRSSSRRAAARVHAAIRRCSASCSRRRCRPTIAAGRPPTTSCTTRSPGHVPARRDARAGLARALVRVRGARRGRPRRPGHLGLRGGLPRGSRGPSPRRCRTDAARRHGLPGRWLRPSDGPRRQRCPLGRSGGRAPPGPWREPRERLA